MWKSTPPPPSDDYPGDNNNSRRQTTTTPSSPLLATRPVIVKNTMAAGKADLLLLPSVALTPSFCFSTGTLKDFLRLSRSHTDDTISQQLNTLSRPPSFDPSTTSSRQPSHRLIPPSTLSNFLTTQLYPTWSARTQVLTYCAVVATTPDPPPPPTSSPNKLSDDPFESMGGVIATMGELEEKSEEEKQRAVNDRLDPYSARYFPKETRQEVLAGIVRNERGVEEIIRERTWEVIKSRSTDGMGGINWQEAYEAWHRTQEKE